MILSYVTVTPLRYKHFKFSQPISIEQIVALVRRKPAFSIRFDNLNANINLGVYGVAVIGILTITVIFVIQQTLLHPGETADAWHMIQLSIPGTNPEELRSEKGATTKV